MKSFVSTKKGMLVLSLAAGMVFIMIIFASLFNRMRAEAVLTNRVSVNERLNQLASAVGRIAIRKLQRDIEFRGDYGREVFKEITDNHKKGPLYKDYTDVVKKMEVIKALKNDFDKKWGTDFKGGSRDRLKVECVVDLGEVNESSKLPFELPINGVVFNENERKGHVDVVVTVSLSSGITRKYTVRKDFIFARLLAPPFYRFTLFSHNGARIRDEEANGIEYSYNGDVYGGKRPLVCINRRMHKDKADEMRTMNFLATGKVVDKREDFIQNGWIYLGGEGYSTDLGKNNKKLLLNVVPGCGDDDFKSKFGEYFHFYYTAGSAGWLFLDNWNSWLNSHIPGNNGVIKMVFVNYGLYKDLFKIKCGTDFFNPDYMVFEHGVKRLYTENVGLPPNSKVLDKGSSMHLFGTPKYCTPTLVFGNVQRRYLRAFGLLYTDLNRVMPLRGVSIIGDGELGFEPTSLKALYEIQLSTWYNQTYRKLNGGLFPSNCIDIELRRSFLTNFFYNKPGQAALDFYYNGNGSNLCGIGPKIVDEEPYMMGLKNICAPANPEYGWKQAVPTNGFCGDSPDKLCDKDYVFKDYAESGYKGRISDIKIDYDTYLKDRSTYTLVADGDTPLSMKKNDFVQKHFFSEAEEGIFKKIFNKLFSKLFGKPSVPKKIFTLNQIIRVKGDLDIDEPLNVDKGGIIICDGSINVKEPIQNAYIVDPNYGSSNPNSFGFVTLIAKKGITIGANAGTSVSGEVLPNIHGFFIAGCHEGGNSKVTCVTPMHIIGGVAADDISNLVNNGGLIEWGFDRDESTNLKEQSFYSLSLGPRDIEIYRGE